MEVWILPYRKIHVHICVHKIKVESGKTKCNEISERTETHPSRGSPFMTGGEGPEGGERKEA